MKNLIYQYWDGELRPGCHAGIANMKAYAERIGAEYLFEHNPLFVTGFGRNSVFYGAYKPVYDESFHEYDNVLYADTDIFAVDGLTDSIFDGFTADIGICTEPHQPKLRVNTGGHISSATDEEWTRFVEKKYGVTVPRTEDGLVKVYNAGLSLWSNAGLLQARDKFIHWGEYISAIDSMGMRSASNFYKSDQPWLHLMLLYAGIDWTELDNDWNRIIHYAKQGSEPRFINDTRSDTSKFVHVQLQGADHLDADTHHRIVHLEQCEWGL